MKIWGEKTCSSRPFLAHPAGGQETTFYLRVAWSPEESETSICYQGLGHIGVKTNTVGQEEGGGFCLIYYSEK